MNRWIIISRLPGLLILAMLILFGLDMAKQGIGQFALIPSLKQSAKTTIPKIPKSLPIPSIPATATPSATSSEPPPPPPPPKRTNCTAIETYLNQC